MLRALWNSKSAMTAQQAKLDCISNNLANVSTEGYKREEVSFQDLVYENINRKGYPTSANPKTSQISGAGVKAGNVLRDNTQGNLTQTGANCDFAIDGPGYFRVIQKDGSFAYERNGSFNVDSAGRLVDKNGNLLSIEYTAEGQNINNTGGINNDNFVVNQSGEISVKKDGNFLTYGKINIYNSVGEDSMLSKGNNLYVPKNGSNIYLENNSDVLQGYLEGSNVDIAKEMTDMIIAQRSFQFGSQGIKTADEMWGIVNSMKR